MKTINLFAATFIVCLSSCAKNNALTENQSQTGFCQDEMGNLYQEGDLTKENVFEHQYNLILDNIFAKEKKPIWIDTRRNPIITTSSSELIQITVWIGFNYSLADSSSFQSYVPVLSYQYSGPGTDNYYSYKKLPKIQEADYKTEKYEFPSRNSYYLSYHYKEEIFINPSYVLEKCNTSKIVRNWGIRMYDEKTDSFCEPSHFYFLCDYRFDSFQLRLNYSDDHTQLEYYVE